MAHQIWNRKQLETGIKALVACELDLQRASYVRAEMMKKAQEDFDRSARSLKDKIGPIAKAIETYLRTDGEEVLNGRKSIQIGRIIIGFRFGKEMLVDPKQKDGVSKEELMDRIEDVSRRATGEGRRQLEETLQVQTTPLLSAIKKLPARLLDRLGLQLHQEEEFFWKLVK